MQKMWLAAKGAIAGVAKLPKRSFSLRSMRLSFARVVLLAIACLANCVSAADKKVIAADLEQSLVGKSFTLHQAYNIAGKQYFKTAITEYLCRHKLTGLFPTRQELTNVTITRVWRDTETEVLSRSSKLDGPRMVTKESVKDYHYWVFSLRHPHLGKGEFRVTTAAGDLPESSEDVRAVLGFVFSGHGLPQHKIFRATKESKLIHYIGSGHIPDQDHGVDFATLEDATKSGFKTCSLCFNHRLRLANSEVELQLGRETESTLRHYYQPLKDTQIQQRVERLGRKVLANWPSRLIGYDYRFNVIDDRSFNAVACAGGFIFVHSGLVELAESDNELEAVLAHEIAHVEQRHGIKQLVRARRQANTAAAIGVIVAGAAVAAAASTDNKAAVLAAGDVASTFGILIYSIGAQIALRGYSRDQEFEADIFALNYFKKMGYEQRHLISILQKVRTSVDLENFKSTSEEDSHSSHPAPNNRIHLAKTIRVEQWPEDTVFDAFNKDGELVYSMTFQGMCDYNRRDGSEFCKVLLDVSTTSAVEDAKSVNELTISISGISRTFTADGSYEVNPMDRIGMAFTYKGKMSLKPDEIAKPRLAGLESYKVVRRSGSN